MTKRRTSLLGVPADLYALEELFAELEKILRDGHESWTVLATNSEKIMLARSDPDLLAALNAADFLIPDGIGAVIALRLLRGAKISRITGIDLMGRLMGLAESKGYRVFLFGAKPDVVRKAAANVVRRHPAMVLAGARDGYLPAAEYPALVDEINGQGTDVLFVGLGSPKQEKWLHKHRPLLQARVCMGVGGSLDVLSGRVSRSPRWLQGVGLEWLYRFLKEPARFWKRVLTGFRFAFTVLKEMICSPETER